MKQWKRLLCLLFITLMLPGLFVQSSAANELYILALNDTIVQPLQTGNMPIRIEGEYFVPYLPLVNASGIKIYGHYSADPGNEMLTLAAENDRTYLTFSMSESDKNVRENGTVIDAPRAIQQNGHIYVSARLIRSKFGLQMSTKDSTSGSTSYTIVRMYDANVALGETLFYNQISSTVTNAINNRGNGGSGSSNNNNTNEPEVPETPIDPPEASENIAHPSAVYLSVVGTPDETHTPDILDAFRTANQTGTFFLSPGSAAQSGDLIRRMLAEGHALGLSVTVDASNAEPDVLLAQLNAENQGLFLASGITTRLVLIENGTDSLSASQRDALTGDGYRLWDTSLDARESERTGYRAAEAVLRTMQNHAAPMAVRLGHYEQSASALGHILRYLGQASVPNLPISLLTTPLNTIAEQR